MVPNLALYLILISEVFAPPRRLADLKFPVRPVAMIQNDSNPNASGREVVGVEQLWAELEAEQESRGESCVQSYRYREKLSAARLQLDLYREAVASHRVRLQIQMKRLEELQRMLDAKR